MSNRTNLRISNILLIIALSFSANSVQAQEFIENLTKIFEFNIGPKRPDSTFRQAKVVLAPIVSFEPSTSWAFGVGSKFLFKPFGAGPDTRTSNIPVSVQYTLNNQFIAFSEFTVFFPQETYLLKGNVGYSKFPIGYFGIGSTKRDDSQVDISFDNLLFEPLILRRVVPNFFLGGGWRYNSYKNLELLEIDLPNEEDEILLDSLGSTSSGLEIAATYDSRDNVLNAGKGIFAEFTHGIYNESLGSSSRFMLTKLNFRRYWTVSEQRPNDVLAIELFSRMSWGDTPILELSSLGGHELLRGFRDGRFRDRYSFFGQVEYRWQALERIGFVFFGGLGDVTDELSNLDLNNIKYSLGSGLRLKIVKSENLNIRIDYAFGLGKVRDNNFYIGIAESF
ncbi:MAG: BamA/TamA family outer membrane protein [Saprospiraceae bacterium]